jgi:hypothetical protein
MPYLRSLLKLSAALALVALAVPASSLGQATRTWVSGVGDDANPCSRTAPCKTFAGAISKTAAGGEINVIDPGGFGGVTITKSLTIKGAGVTAGVLVANTNAIVINAAATDKVTIRGLDINGIGVGAQTSLNGIKVISAKSVHIFDNEIYRFQAGINVNPVSAQTRVLVKGNHIHDNGVGVINTPGNNTISFSTVTLRYNDISDNNCGAVSGAFGANASTPNANTDCGTATSASLINKPAVISAFNNGFEDNTPGSAIFSRGGNSTFEIGLNDISGNAVGLNRPDGGVIRSFQNNIVSNNGSTTAPSATAGATKNGSKPSRKRHRM